ncbi:MAG: hypothetical protein JRI95_00840 [Deltaproteobacteria bacterium]|nr:hypothetical protein [Deltaproteobacteria bacterium]MBW2085505.1 hypothetical protein [Deltaproteobacteria bacterium]
MTLFTKENCGKCENIKRAFDLNKLGINIEVIKADDPEVLANLAWYELVELVEKGALPILVLDDSTHVKYELPVRRFLERHIAAMNEQS